MNMKNVQRILILTACLVSLVMASMAQGAPSSNSCSNRTLDGDYAFRLSGEVFTQGGLVYRDGVAMTHFDGNGGLTQVDWVIANGVTVPGPLDPNGFHDNETGSYNVYANCTGDAEIDFPIPPHGTSGAVIKLKFVIGNRGSALHTIVYSLTPPNATQPVPANIHSDAVKVSGQPAFEAGGTL
jgi:hypothetical protein